MHQDNSPTLDRVLQRLALLRMFLPLMAVSLLAIGAVGVLAERTLVRQQSQQVQFVARIVDQYLDQAVRTLDAVARGAEITPSQRLAFMQSIFEAYGYFDTLYHVDANGKIRQLVPPDPRYLGLDMSNLLTSKQTGEKQQRTISRPFVSLHTGNPTVYLARQLSVGGQIVSELNLGSLQEEITRGRYVPVQGMIFIMDKQGMLLAHPDLALVRQQINQSNIEIFQRAFSGNATLIYEYDGVMVLGSATLVEQTGWVVVSQIPLLAAVSPYMWALGLTLVASLVLWLVLTWNLRRQLQREVVIPLVKLSQGIDALANGEFDRGKGLASFPVAFAELTTLAANFQHMSDALQARQIELQESETRYRLIAENTADTISVFDLDLKPIFTSPAVQKLRGYTVEEAMRQSLDHVLTPESLQKAEALFAEQMALEEDGKADPARTVMLELEQYCQGGSTIWVELAASFLRDADLQPIGILTVSRDITERKRLEAQILQTQKMEAVGQLAGGVAHDFNNMLGVIIGHTELALGGPDLDASLRNTLQEILAAGLRSSEIIRQLLAFARKQTIAPIVLDLNEVVDGMLKLLRRLIGEDIELVWMPGSNLWPVKMDPSQIDQMLANLCINARDAIAGVGRIAIETRCAVLDDAYCLEHPGSVPGDYVMLTVSDNGSGMQQPTLEKIFEPFFTTKGRGKGTGLGLSTVYGIVKQNHGFIDVDSEPGHGSTFTLYLPRHSGRVSRAPEASDESQDLSGHETILVVEDEILNLKLVEQMLKRFGYRVLTASLPREALHTATCYTADIHLLLTDLIMPEMNGRDLAEEITVLFPDIRCLFMSGYSDNVIAHQGILDDGVHFIQKPFSMQSLGLKVREILDAGQSRHPATQQAN